MVRHKIKFRYNGRADDVSITLAFRKKAIEQQRKEWLTGWIEEEETWFGGRNLCEKDTQLSTTLTSSTRSWSCSATWTMSGPTPSLMDGLKSGRSEEGLVNKHVFRGT